MLLPQEKLTTTSGTKLITVPKTTAGKVSTPVVMVPSTGQTVTRTVKMLPQTSIMKVVARKNQSKRTATRGIKGTQVSGSHQYGPSENTRSQTKDRRRHATQTAVTSYEKVVVDAITSDSESEGVDEDVNQISNEEVIVLKSNHPMGRIQMKKNDDRRKPR